MAGRYPHDGMLLDWKDPGGGFTTGDATAGILCLGGTGSGKSSGPGAALQEALLSSTATLPGGMGGIALFAKCGEADGWVNLCRKHGRGSDVIRITTGSRYSFNFLSWISSWGEDGRGPIVPVDFLEQMAAAIDPKSAGAGDGENAFFAGAHRAKLLNLVLLCQLARLPVALPLMRALSNSAPQTPAQSKDAAWQRTSECWQALREAEAVTRADPAAWADFIECRRYFLQDYPSLSDRTRGVIDIMFTSLVQPFLTRPLRPLFCEQTTVTPEACFDGKILLIDIPVQEYGLVGRLAGHVWRRAFQLAIMRRSGPPGSLRPSFWFCDEAQNYIVPSDAEYTAVSRSAGGVTVLMTQTINSIREAMGSDDKAESLCSNLQLKIICQSVGETAQWASTLIGERYINVTDINVGRGGGVQAGVMGDATTHSGISRHEVKRSFIEPSVLSAPAARRPRIIISLVDAVVFCGGKLFASENGELAPLQNPFLPAEVKSHAPASQLP